MENSFIKKKSQHKNDNYNINNKKKIIINELKTKLDNLNFEFIKERQSFINELNIYNKTIAQKENGIKEIKTEINDLINKLKDIKNELDSHAKLSQIFKLKLNELDKKEKEIKSSIRAREEEIKNEIKNMNKIKKEKERIQKLINENKENRENILNNEYESLNNNIKNLQNEINNLKYLLNVHQDCQKYKNILKNAKNVLENEYEFEIKKINMLKAIDEEKDNKNKQIKKLLFNRIKNKKKVIKNNSQKNIELSKRTKSYIYQQFDLVQKSYNKNSFEVSNIFNESLSIQKPRDLFLSEEKKILKTIIPERNLNIYNERYNDLEKQKKLIEEKIKNNKSIINEINNHKNLINYSSIKIKQQFIVKTAIKAEFIRYRNYVAKLNKKIKEINKEIKIQDNILKIKNKENNNYKNHLFYLQKKIKKGKLILKINLEDENNIENKKDEIKEKGKEELEGEEND